MRPGHFTDEVLRLLRDLGMLRETDEATTLAFDSALSKLLYVAKLRIPRGIRVRARAESNGNER